MTDFFEDVEETLRSDRYQALMRRSWPWALAIAAVLLLGALGWWGYDTWRTQELTKASEAYNAALQDLQKGDLEGGFGKFGEAAKTSARGYKSMALMGQGAIRLDQGKTQEAVKLYDAAAAAAPSDLLGDLARLKSAFALIDTATYPAIEERLKPLSDPKRPYHVAAREALAMAKIKAGRLKEARSELQLLTLMPDATDASRQIAQVAILAIDSGAAQDVAKVIAAAKSLPQGPQQLQPPDLGAGPPGADVGADQPDAGAPQ